MQQKKFYVTTPIYYANGLPHIGHANSSFIADLYARRYRLMWYEVKFSTWVDENWQKMVEKAESEWKDVKTFLDEIAAWSVEIWKELQISYTDFIRTTSEDHKEFVQKMLNIVHDQSESVSDESEKDIYVWSYEWLYCTWCEAFKNERDLNEDWLCPDHLTKPEKVSETNLFFNLKKYSDIFAKLWAENPTFVEPETRFNEVKAFVKSGLENFSISRENKHNWIGIPLPWDSEQVTYVWFDALFNYITVCYRNGENGKFWDNDTYILHILWKDIVKFHATYRPAMLEATDNRLPDKEFVTWYLTVDGQKMSKSLGNVVDPIQVSRDYDRDALVFYLLNDVPLGSDWDFSWERFNWTWEKMLIGWWGNLVNRVSNLWKKYWITEWKFDQNRWNAFKEGLSDFSLLSITEGERTNETIEKAYLENANTKAFVEDWYRLVQAANEYISKAEPWKKYKEEATQQEALDDLSFLLRVIKQLGLVAAPLLINGFAHLQKILWNAEIQAIDTSKNEKSDFKSIFDAKSYPVNLNPEIMYQRKEQA